jgi:membrane-bound lytic murein transglycosylase D
VPVAAATTSSIARSTRYVARKGDTLVTVADRFNVSVDELRGWNHLKGTTIVPGHSLYVSEPARVSSPRGHHTASTKSHTAAASTKSSHDKSTADAKPAPSSTAHPASAFKAKKKHSSAP